MKRILFLMAAMAALSIGAHAQNYGNIYGSDGRYLGQYNLNQFDPNSIFNQFGRYGSQFSPDSINNQFGRYGSEFMPNSARNPFTMTPPTLYNWSLPMGQAPLTTNPYLPFGIQPPSLPLW
ncbi:MAG TPA: hypothetical protein VKB88_21475 [Bryobacteraceae bacterium]|nr:hypothetical protein [Bryobacteraceae bacterium]